VSDAGAGPVGAAAPEDEARANLYALIARLFRAAPDALLIGELLNAAGLRPEAGRPTPAGAVLAEAWDALVAALRTAFPVMLEHEHTALFVGPGKAEVTPYAGHYLMRHETDMPLVRLREQLTRWGIARKPGVAEYEDHVAAICETMRFLIVVQHRSIEEQREFFERYVLPGVGSFCSAVSASSKANFYRLVAVFAQAFLALEREAFEML
jgi:TorA maturation chaperone TorD